MICIVFTYELASVRTELNGRHRERDRERNDQYSEDEECAMICRWACEKAFKTAAMGGFSSVTFACSDWTKEAASPMTIG
jgi:hypothetical protein